MIPRLLSFVVPADCYPGGVPSQDLPSTHRVSFAEDVTMLGDAPPPACLPESGTQELLCSAVTEGDMLNTEGGGGDDRLHGSATHHYPTSAGISAIFMAL